MKKYIGNFFKKKAGKRLVSGLTAFVMVFCALPSAEIGEKIGELDFTSWSVKAADDSSAPDPEFPHDEGSDTVITIKVEDFYRYSQNCQKYPVFHKNDDVVIRSSGGNTTWFDFGFEGLGTKQNPFAGSVSIESNGDVVLNLDAPLFNYVKDTVVLNTNNSLKISRFYGNNPPSGYTMVNTTPLLAEHVVSDDSNKPKATWNIQVTKPSATDDGEAGELESFGGMIGTMEASSKLTLNVTMNTAAGDEDPINLNGDSALGVACGLMETGSELTFSLSGSRKVNNIVTTSGNVGGLVGEMKANSIFSYNGANCQTNQKDIQTSYGYAGGVVGKIVNATVNLTNSNAYAINQHMIGKSGAGGIYGYYEPKSTVNTVDISKYSINNCYVNGEGNDGGLFGELVTDHSFTIDTAITVKSYHGTGAAETYGGLVGKYTSTSAGNELIIGGVTTETHKSGGTATAYGGAVGLIDPSKTVYVNVNGFILDKAYNAKSLTFGGLIGKATNAFVDVNAVTVKVDDAFAGGGLVGNLGDGVLRLRGTTNLSDAKSMSADKDGHLYGQIVGFRDNALIFAETGWILKRSVAVEADDIGGWGEVIRFSSKTESTDENTSDSITQEMIEGNLVLTVNETKHTVLVDEPTNQISTTADFEKAALRIQLSNTNYVTFSGDITQSDMASEDIYISEDLSLAGTGFTGFTRDNHSSNVFTESHCVFSGTLNTDGKTVTLAIGEPYGYRDNVDLSEAETRSNGDGRIYNHRFNGLFGVTNDAQIGDNSSLGIDGNCAVSPKANSVYVGAVSAVAKNSIRIYNTDVSTEFNYGGNKEIYLGRLVGEVNSPVNSGENGDTYSIDITSCTSSGDVKGSNSGSGTCIGGVFGKIYHNTNEEELWYFDSVTVSGKIENTGAKDEQMIGGLIAKIEGYTATKNFKSRLLTLDNVTIQGVEISGACKSGNDSAKSIGGLLGYQWLNTDVQIGVSDDDHNSCVTITTGSKITMTGNSNNVGDMAGLVYNATGNWTVNDLDINDITVTATKPKSLGMIVNKGWYTGKDSSGNEYDHLTHGTSSALYLMLPATDSYTITSSTLSLGTVEVFDELVAYSAYYKDTKVTRSASDSDNDKYVLKNGAGVVSIKTSALNMNGSSASNSYKAQTSLGATPNPWTRYYYNLDTVTSSNTSDLGTAQKKLMSWGLNQYAHQSIRSNFANPFSKNVFDDTTYDMVGYSWYPVDVDANVTVKGTFKFYNKEFELSENSNGGSHNSQKTSLYHDPTTQHYLLHAGLLRNVYTGKTVTVNNVTLQGNVGVINRTEVSDSDSTVVTDYSGALICGKVEGSSDTSKVSLDINGLTLDGVYIHNITDVTGDSITYAPLVINNITQYTTLTAKNISTTNKYTTNTTVNVKYIKKDTNDYPKAASSLIGQVGSSDAKGLNLNFTLIKLDGRLSNVTDTDQNNALNTAYGTNRTIFTKSILLDTFQYESGTTGTYTYTYANDWSGGRNVTYGKEVGYTASDTTTEYPGQERIYSEETEGSTARYTNPVNNNDTSGLYSTNFKNDFLPYVFTPYDVENKTHQLQVNHMSSKAEGCGTYNDPYMIQKGSELETFAKILNGTYDGTTVVLPTQAERTVKWCDDKTGQTKHKEYSYSNGNYVSGSDTLTTDEVRTYLAGAYYQLKNGIELSGNYVGLGSSTIANAESKNAVFRGVIDGNGFTIKNKSIYPLINNSYGSVVRNLTITVDNSSISYTQSSWTDKFPTCKSYGGAIGAILGGDNIIDNVSVTYSSNTNIYVLGSAAQIIPVGGYVGVVVDGGLIFRNMEGKGQSFTSSLYYSSNSPRTRKTLDSSSNMWLYVNPIIGRVIDGYAVTESSAYHPFEDGTRTYGDGTTEYWQSDGSIVTKTKAQLDAMTDEQKEALKTSAAGVTLKNSNKNYSITDIKSALKKENNAFILSDAEKLYPKNNGIDVPNAQAFFLMSLMVNSGMSIMSDYNTATYNDGAAIGYYDGNFTTRGKAQYNQIGTGNTDDYGLTVTDARWADKTDDEKTSITPYLIRYYTKQYESNYYARKIAYSKNSNTVNLTNSSTYNLPDGFKGFGNIFQNDENLRLRIETLNGNNSTISQNTRYYYYDNDAAYCPSTGERSGFGLINFSSAAGKYKNFYLTGNVKTDLISKSDGSFDTSKSAQALDPVEDSGGKPSKYLCAGMLIGTAKGSPTVTNVSLQNIDVFGIRNTGGLIGFLTEKSTLNYNIESTVAEGAYNSDRIKVYGRASTGGLMGKSNKGYVKVDMNNHTFNLTEVVCECSNRGGNYYDYGVGGFIGMMRAGDSSADIAANSFKNIVIGTAKKEQTVKCENADIFTAGVVGIMNKSKGITIENCTFYNLSVKAKFGAAGLVAFPTTYTKAKVTNTHLYSPLGSTIESTTDFAGGLIGNSDPRSGAGNGSQEFKFENCSVEGYTISGKNGAGGIIGFRGAYADNVNLILNNIEVTNCTIKSDNAAGGLIGEMNEPVVGYNILMEDVKIEPFTSGTTISHKGYICGYITTSSADITYIGTRTGTKPTIKIAGFSRKLKELTTMESELVGTCNYGSDNDFGEDGYVIFADYTNAARDTRKSTMFSPVNSQNNVQSMALSPKGSITITRVVTTIKNNNDNTETTSSYCTYSTGAAVTKEQAETQDGSPVVTTNDNTTTTITTYKTIKNYYDNTPYVTSSPLGYIGQNQFLTGDAMSGVRYSDTNFAFRKIIEDKQSTDIPYAYNNAPDINDTKLNDVTSNLSTSTNEYGIVGMSSFPMLIVEDNDKNRVTNYINYYLQNLTNTTLDFANCNVSRTANYSKFKVVLNKCVYDSSSRTFKIDNTEDSASLKLLHRVDKGNHFFQMSASEIDNANIDVQQFSLIDVQFFDPSSVTSTDDISTAKIAYHLYVPVYVKKLIQYDFSAKLASNTNYYTSAYSTISSNNTLFENLGNSVTMKIEYTYKRTEDDWKNAINGGDSVLTNFYKGLNLTMNENGWIPKSRMVLVDPNNQDKHYYNDTALTSEDFDDTLGYYHIDFDTFTTTGTSSGTKYSPAPFNNLMDVTIIPSDDGTLTTANSESEATVRGVNGQFYKPCPEDDTTSPRYTVSKVENIKPETYYISFFTNKNEGNNKIYHYEIKSRDSFTNKYSDSNWRPNKVNRLVNEPVHLIIGNLYTNDQMELNVTPLVPGSFKMSKSNNILTVTMTAHIGLTGLAKTANIQQNLAKNPNSTIYQTFLMNYAVTELNGNETLTKIGVDTSSISSIRVTSYKIYHGSTVSGTGADVAYSEPEDHMNSNYIELRNNQNLNEYLRDSAEGHDNMATIQVVYAIEYSDKNLSRQFPERTDETDETQKSVGAVVRGYSNISSTVESGAYSATSTMKEDIDATTNKSNKYYTTNLASATLMYNAEKTMTSPDGQYSSLGINPFDEGTKTTNKGHIDSTATYSYLDLQDPGDYIEFNLTLTSKKDGYNATTPLDIRQYFQNLKIKANQTDTDANALYIQGTNTSTANVVASMSNDGKTITLRAKKDSLHKVADKIYSISISFDVLTGETNGFGTTKAYSNYKVNLTADMYGSIDTTATPDTQPHASDHIIYTNSKLQYKMI